MTPVHDAISTSCGADRHRDPTPNSSGEQTASAGAGGCFRGVVQDLDTPEQTDLHGHPELIAGAAFRQGKVAVGAAERTEPDQGGVITARLEKPCALGVIQQAPSRRCAPSDASQSVANLSWNHA
jgi:hypothetical protein